ncbi:MAG: c-type cytochrome [Deltaproteobacteria bacterium]|nr:c-type cytochrome [Deltaproteobacteria bacterium]
MRSNFLKLFSILLLFGEMTACAKVKMDPEAEGQITKLEAQGDLILVKRIQETVPIDPFDAAWQEAKAVTIPLGPQISVSPRSAGVNHPDGVNHPYKKFDLTVRALGNNKEVGLLLSWKDATVDDRESGVTLFRDAVAVGFPMNHDGSPLPYIGMGNPGNPVNIWHWKASLEAPDGPNPILRSDLLEAGYPINHRTGEEAGNPKSISRKADYVENLLAEGFGTLTSTPSEGLMGRGLWKNNEWQVVIKRPRNPKGSAVALSKGFVPITFAVWDGAISERNGMKGLTRWRFLRFEGEAVPKRALQNLVIDSIPGANASRGKQLTVDLGCVSCHNLPLSPATNVGPDLTHAGMIHRIEYLLESVKNPNAVIVPAPGYYDPKTLTSTMPSFGDQVPDKDYNDIAEYLRSLQ